MTRKYKNPSVVEAFFEVIFADKKVIDPVFPGLFFNEIKEEYADRDIQNIVQVPNPSLLPVIVQKSLFYKDLRKSIIQIAPRMMAVNRLKPYTKWEVFKPEIEKALSIFDRFSGIDNISKLSLRYINIFEFPKGTIELEEFFNFYPHYKPVKDTITSFISGCGYPKDDGSVCKVQIESAPGDENVMRVALSLEYFRFGELPKESISSWLEDGHSEIVAAFENCITDSTRKKMETE